MGKRKSKRRIDLEMKYSDILAGMGIKPVPNHPGYFADKKGQVYSALTGKMKKLKLGDNYRGYHCLAMRRSDGQFVTRKIHQVILETFVGPKPPGAEIARHLNDDGYDNRLENLAWGTNRDNIEDQKKNGRTDIKRNNRNQFEPERREILMRIYQSGVCDEEALRKLLKCSEKALKHLLKTV